MLMFMLSQCRPLMRCLLIRMEIIKESLISIGDEMFIAMPRTSMSTIIYEVLDYATGIMDAEIRLSRISA